MPEIIKLLKRADFQRASASPFVWKGPHFVMQLRLENATEMARIGFTVTKKQGNAVMRNRIRRRLRETCRLCLPDIAKIGCDYVVIGRQSASECEFKVLQEELAKAIQWLHRKAGQ